MKKIIQISIKKAHLLTFFTISALCFLSWNQAASQGVSPLKEGSKGHPKIESILTQLLEEHIKEGRAVSKEFAKGHGIEMDQQGMITVFILPEVGKTKEAIDVEALKSYGCEIIKSGDYVIKARVPISMLEEIADMVKGISFIKLPDKPHADVVSEGVNLTGAFSYHSANNTGSGVKVAIIDSGFAGLSSAKSAGELPSGVVSIDCTGTSCVPTTFPLETEKHGTAVAEIVHNMAPEGQLYLIKVADSLDLINAKDYCIANGIKVINHSAGWFNTNFYDGACYNDFPVCTVNNAYSNGILWVNSAGNHARKHYEAIFSDPDGNGWHNVPGYGECININANTGETIKVYLTWDAWPVTNQDYNLYLYLSNLSGLHQVAYSITRQTGTQLPTEQINYSVPISGTYCFAIEKYNAALDKKLEIFSANHDLPPYVSTSSILSPADATSAMAVAAIDQAKWTTGPQEYFSSQGPTTDGRIKPDISGPDNASNYTYSPGNFSGTSAAAPHVAGAAALILYNYPNYSVSQLWDSLTGSAIDVGSTGKGNIYGFGRLNFPPKPNLTPFQASGFSDKIVVSNLTGTNKDSSPLDTKDKLYVDWAATNNGDAATTASFYAPLYVDGALKDTWYTNPPLNTDFYIFVDDYSIGSLGVGTHRIKIVTDSTNAVDESNERDNEYTKTITVFGACSNPFARRAAGGSYNGVQDAYDVAVDKDTILSQAVVFGEDPDFNRNISVTIRGGYDCDYSTNAQKSVVNGTITIRNGTVTMENIIIR